MDPIYFLHAGAGAFFLGFFIFDIILSRALFAFGAALLTYGLAAQTLTSGWAISYAALAVLANLVVIWRSLTKQWAKPLTPQEQTLGKHLKGFSKADFRRLLKISQWETLHTDKSLTQEGAPTTAIYYIVSGAAKVHTHDTQIEVGDHALIGEMSFAKGGAATATVEAQAGSVLITWPLKKLRKALKRPSLNASFTALLNQDLSEKLTTDEARRSSQVS
mgnify:FL=1